MDRTNEKINKYDTNLFIKKKKTCGKHERLEARPNLADPWVELRPQRFVRHVWQALLKPRCPISVRDVGVFVLWLCLWWWC